MNVCIDPAETHSDALRFDAWYQKVPAQVDAQPTSRRMHAEAPPSAAALSLVSWHCGTAPSSKDVLPCAVAGWHLEPAFKPFGGRMLPCAAPAERHPAARVGEAMLMPDHISLVVGLQLVCADPGNPNRPRLCTARCRGTVTAARLLRKVLLPPPCRLPCPLPH